MSIVLKKIQDNFIRTPGRNVIGPSVARCPRKNYPGYGELLMAADLFDGSDSNVGTMLWRSKDEGETWEQQRFLEYSYVCDFNDTKIKSGYGGIFSDDEAGVVVYVASDIYWLKEDFNSTKKYRRIYYRLSYDNGATWTDKHYVVQKGTDPDGKPYDLMHFMKDVTYGVNMAAVITPKVIRADDGSLIVSVQAQMVDEKGELIEPSGFMFLKAGAFKLFWNTEKLDYDWEFGDFVEIDPSLSARGLYEPTFTNLGGGRLAMVMRNSNMSFRDTITGQKFIAISEDNGRTWSGPKPLTYDDGTTMFAASCIPKLLEHSNGKVYYVGVINDENPDGNLPRYPLCIAEFDRATCTVKKSTVTVIDTVRKEQQEWMDAHPVDFKTTYPVDYSNHWAYENSRGEIVVLAPHRADLRFINTTLNRYTIVIK